MKSEYFLNFGSQVLVSILGIAVFPLYFRIFSVEDYGVIAIFSMIVAIFVLFDFGFGPALAKRAGESFAESGAIDVVKSQLIGVEVFIFVLLLIVLIADYWSSLTIGFFDLSHIENVQLIVPMMLCAALSRVCCGIYRTLGIAVKRTGVISLCVSVFGLLRYGVPLAYAMYYSPSIVNFFMITLFLSLLEMSAYRLVIVRSVGFLPKKASSYLNNFRSLLAPASAIGISSLLWVLVSQLDKFILSGLLSLEDYAFFSLIPMLGGGLLTACLPFYQVLLPRLTEAQSRNDRNLFLTYYRFVAQLITVFGVGFWLCQHFLQSVILEIWFDGKNVPEWLPLALDLYLAGYVLITISLSQYFYLFATNQIRLYMTINIISSILHIFIVCSLAIWGGVIYAALGWLLYRMIYFTVVPVLAHHDDQLTYRYFLVWILPTFILSAIIFISHYFWRINFV